MHGPNRSSLLAFWIRYSRKEGNEVSDQPLYEIRPRSLRFVSRPEDRIG
jgi:hypothetical protein